MSYILNALRKSEQERLAQQPDTVTGRILVNQPQPRQKTNKAIILLLVISNLIVAAGFFWFVRKESTPPLPADVKTGVMPDQTPLKPAIVPPVNESPLATRAIKITKPAAPPQAELAPSKKTVISQLPTTKLAAKKNPALTQPQPELVMPKMESDSMTATPVEPAEIVEKNEPPISKDKEIPFLYELSPEFRHTVPDMKINVFVYSEQPAERFVMIDMVKYKVGEQIKESIELKEIRSDSLVVVYNNRTFRIKRP